MWLLHNRIIFLLTFFCSTLFFTFVFTTSITQTQNQDVVGDDGDMPDTSGLLPDTMDPVESVSEPIKIVDGLKNADGKLIYDALNDPRVIDIITVDNDDGTKSHYGFVASGKYVIPREKNDRNSTNESDNAIQFIDILSVFRNNPIESVHIFDSDTLSLDGAFGVSALSIDDEVYVIAASSGEGVQALRLDQNQDKSLTLTPVGNIDDTSGILYPGGFTNISTATINGTPYAFVIPAHSLEGVQALRLDKNQDKSLNLIPVGKIAPYNDPDNLILTSTTKLTITKIGSSTYVLVTSYGDDVDVVGVGGVQALRVEEISNEITFTPAGNIADTNDLELNGAYGITTTTIAGTPYAFIASERDNGVQALKLDQNSDKSLTLTPVGNITDNNDLVLDGPIEIITTTIKGISYAFITSERDNGVQVLDISDPTSLIPVATISDGEDGFMDLAGAWGIDIETINNTPYAFVTSSDDDAVQILNLTDPSSPSTTVNSTIESKTSIVVERRNIKTQEDVSDSALRFFQGLSSAKVNSYIEAVFSCGVAGGLTSINEDFSITQETLKDYGFLLPAITSIDIIPGVSFSKIIVVAFTIKFLGLINSDGGITCIK